MHFVNTFFLFVLLLSLVSAKIPPSSWDTDISDSIDDEYWKMVEGFKDDKETYSKNLLFENLFSCHLCQHIVEFTRPLLLKKVEEEKIKKLLARRFCSRSILEIKDYDKDIQLDVKKRLKMKICMRIVTENIVDIFTSLSVAEGSKLESGEYICENTDPSLCKSWMRGTFEKVKIAHAQDL